MIQTTKALFMICESPLHAGAGTGIGYIDNPIQREKHTGFPKVEGSSMKGAIRERFSKALTDKETEISLIFGPAPSIENPDKTFASALSFGDARLLLFPVQSPVGVFAYITCPRVLQQFSKDMEKCNKPKILDKLNLNNLAGKALVVKDAEILIDKKYLVLEESLYDIDDRQSPAVLELAEKISTALFGTTNDFISKKIKDSLVILPNEDFHDFIELSTEVITRNRIDSETGTAADGGLFTEEYLPQESVLYSLIYAQDTLPGAWKRSGAKDKKLEFTQEGEASELMDFFRGNLNGKLGHRFQLGANHTVGKGLIYANLKTQ